MKPREAMAMAVTTVYTLPFTRYLHVTDSFVKVECTKFLPNTMEPVAWAIREGGSTLAKDDNQWEIEPSPSNRDEEYLERSRFRTAKEAIVFAVKHFDPETP